MRKKRLLYFREPDVRNILERCLVREGYRIYAKVRLQDVIDRDRSERLPTREFDYLTRAHLDFVVAKNEMPVFAVEFDGQHHLYDAKAIERDVIKNSLCKAADLPLLRITSTETQEPDRLTLLEYMLIRYVAWGREGDDLMEELAEFATTIGPEADPDDYAVDLDPTVQFDLKHPFPGTRDVRERLLREFGIMWMGPPEAPGVRYVCDLLDGWSGACGREQFHTCQIRPRVWAASDRRRQTPIFADDVSVAIRAWLPLLPSVPPAPELASLFNPKDLEAFRIRIESMWFPHLPGMHYSDVAENYAEYLGLRAVERWAERNLKASASGSRSIEAGPASIGGGDQGA